MVEGERMGAADEKYGHFGKEYNGERAVISLTSWKARIDTVGMTIFNIFKKCPGFHIVLVLSEEEFPRKEKELPEKLVTMAKFNVFEILWVYKNYKAFKKILFTMDKYRAVPIISADDDCLYRCNYAAELYDEWRKKGCLVTYLPIGLKNPTTYKNFCTIRGPATIYPPYYFKHYGISCLTDTILERCQDDNYYCILCNKLSYTRYFIINKRLSEIATLQNLADPLSRIYTGNFDKETSRIYEDEIKIVLAYSRKTVNRNTGVPWQSTFYFGDHRHLS